MLTQQKFGKLIVIRRVGSDKWGNSLWLCRCDCGDNTLVVSRDLNNGHTKSCGCLRKEKTIIRNINRTVHGHCNHKTYKSWQRMIQRCININNIGYKDYGGRGITVCERWRNFSNFLKDMGERPTNRYQIDRIKNNKGYCKENCRWATPKQNGRNRRNNHLVTYEGKTQCISAWSEETGISECVIRWRLKHCWSIKRSLTILPRKK